MFPRMLNTFDPRLTTAYLGAILAVSQEKISAVKLYRKYIVGDQAAALTDSQENLLGASTLNFTLNICMLIVSIICDRLKVRDVTVVVPGDSDDQELSETLNEVLRQTWDYNRMDERTADNHYMSSRDGESFFIIEYDETSKRVKLYLHELFDGEQGVYGVYSEDHTTPLYFVKRWKSTVNATDINNKRTIQRMNIYYPNRVEKWVIDPRKPVNSAATWQPYLGDGDPVIDFVNDDGVAYQAAIAWWTDTNTADGEPLGFPVFHFKANVTGTAEGRSDLADIVPGVQDGINTANAMLHAAEQLQGTPMMVLITDAAFAKDDDSSEEIIELFPGSPLKLPSESNIAQFQAADLRQLSEILDARIRRAAMIAQVPPYNLVTSGQVAAEGTQKQNEILLLAKATRRQVNFGNRYEDMARMVLKLLATFDQSFNLITVDQVDDLSISCEWYPAEIRNEVVDLQMTQTLASLGVPLEDALRVSNVFTVEEITDIMRRKRLDELSALASALRMAQTDQAAQLAQVGQEMRVMEAEVAV